MSKLFKNYIMFKATIPYEFKLNYDNIIITTNVKLDDNLYKRIRNLSIYKEIEFVKDQRIPSTNSFFSKLVFPSLLFSYNISKIEVHLELFENEIVKIKEYFSDKEKGIKKLSSIFQNILLVFSRLYNETMSGNEYYKPVVDYYGPFVCSLYLEDNPNESNSSIISSSYCLDKITNYKQPIDILNIKPLQWRNYYNRSIDAYNMCDYLDSILFSSISIESYIIDLIKKNNMMNSLKILKDSYKLQGKSVSFFQEVKLLKDKGFISNKMSNDITRVFGLLSGYRNSIVHGDLDEPFISKEVANKCITKVMSFYNTYEIDNL